MFRSILPKEGKFNDFFERHNELALKAVDEFLSLFAASTTMALCAKRIKDLEHEMDDLTHQCTEQLHKTFITPIERSDIFDLIKKLDDVADNLDGAISRMILYEVPTIREEVKTILEIIRKACVEIQKALVCLRKAKDFPKAISHCIAVHGLENDGDIVFRSALSRLFRETDAVMIIKWKEIFERLEMAVDRCDHVANIIEGICVENA